MKHRTLLHTDSDGHCAAGIVYQYLRKKGVKDEEMAFHPINYGMPIPPEIDYANDTVYMVDFSFQPLKTMVEFAEKLGDRLIWIDHHSTSVDMEEEAPELRKIPGIRQVNYYGDEKGTPISGCELVWFYLYQGHTHPPVVQLVGEWDTWRWKNKPEDRQDTVQAFQHYLRSVNSNPKYADGRAFWYALLGGSGKADTSIPQEGLAVGKILLDQQRKSWKGAVGGSGFTADFQGHRAVMVNRRGNSEMFRGFFDEDKHDVMVTFELVKGEYLTVGMYTTKTDLLHLGNLCKKLGEAGDYPSGGGHAGAAGFQCSWDYFKTLYAVTGDLSRK